MRDFEITHFDFDFEEGISCQRMRDFRNGDDYPSLSIGGKQVFTPERETRIQAHCKRVQTELKRRKR